MSRTDAMPGVSVLVAARERVRSVPGGFLAWRIGVTVVGLLVIVVGIVLLPLPGPGWLVIFLGLGIWATEYAWAARLLGWVRARVSEWWTWIGARPRWLQIVLGVLAFAGTLGITLAALVIF